MMPPRFLFKAGMAALAAIIARSPASAEPAGSRPTREFVQAAAQSHLFETLEAVTALAESQNPKVRAFAQQMIDTHQRMRGELVQVVDRAALERPSPGIGGDQSAFLASLQSQRGNAFDRTYMRQQVLAHRAALATAQTYATSGDAPDLRSLAAAEVDVIKDHLKMAEQLQASLGSP